MGRIGWREELERIAARDLRRAAKIATLDGRGLLDSRITKALRGVEDRVNRLGDTAAVARLLHAPANSWRQQHAARALVHATRRLDERLDRAVARHALSYEVDQTQRRFERALAAHHNQRVDALLAHTLRQTPSRPPLT